MTLISRIDSVLLFLSLPDNRYSHNSIEKIMVSSVRSWGIEVSDLSYEYNGMYLILKKLYEDGYVAPLLPPNLLDPLSQLDFVQNSFQITFNGLVFLEQGAYSGQIYRSNLEERRVRISQTLTWILAVGITSTFVKDLFDVSRDYYNPILKPLVYIVVPFSYVLFLVWLLYTILAGRQPKQNKNREA